MPDYSVPPRHCELPRYDKRITHATLSFVGRASHNGLRGNAFGLQPPSAVSVACAWEDKKMSDKIYEVPAEWTKRALINDADYKKMYAQSLADPNGFWGEQAKRLHWMKQFTKVKDTSFAPNNVSIKWFEDGALNVAYN